MCGIVGYAGNVRTACGKPLEVCLQGLQRLEYRGYDSAGVALTAPGMERVAVRKKAGRLANLVQDIERDPMPDATVGIGHTRWATNGVPNDTNAHPHTSRDGKVAIIHNGIIENASQPRLDLQTEGYRFVSETDTEVAAKLLGKISDKIIAENQLTAMMVTHNMKDAIVHGNRLIMMHEGKVIYDVAGEEKKNLQVKDLLAKFEEVSGGEFANDRMMLA